MRGEMRFTRLDSGYSVQLSHDTRAVPRPPALAMLMQQALAPQSDAATRLAFGQAWQEWVRAILLEHADDPAFISVEG